MLHPTVERVTARLADRSATTRTAYLERIDSAAASFILQGALDRLSALGRPVFPDLET